MTATVEQLLGDHAEGRIRGIALGSPLSEAIEREGDDFSERRGRKLVKYIHDVAPGEELELVLAYDDDRRVSALTLHYNYYLAAHDDDPAPFERLADEVRTSLAEHYGDGTSERRDEETMIRSWRLEAQPSRLVAMTHRVEDRDDYRYDRWVLKLEHKPDA